MMHPLVALAYTTIAKTLDAGEAKGHGKDSWREEPKENHAWKAIRHLTTAQGVDVLPEFFPDRESAIQHAEQGLVRAAMYLQILLDEKKRSAGKGNMGNGSAPCQLGLQAPMEKH